LGVFQRGGVERAGGSGHQAADGRAEHGPGDAELGADHGGGHGGERAADELGARQVQPRGLRLSRLLVGIGRHGLGVSHHEAQFLVIWCWAFNVPAGTGGVPVRSAQREGWAVRYPVGRAGDQTHARPAGPGPALPGTAVPVGRPQEHRRARLDNLGILGGGDEAVGDGARTRQGWVIRWTRMTSG